MPQALYKKLGMSKKDFKNKLVFLYKNNTQSEIAEVLGCNTTCIEDWFGKLNIPGRSPSEAQLRRNKRNVNISNYEHNVLNGLMLSDLYIEESPGQGRLSCCFKHLEFLNRIISELSCFSWLDPKYNKSAISWHSKTKYYYELKRLRNIWYNEDRIKIVPKDIIINKHTLKWWFLGDGMLRKYAIILCTDSFLESDTKWLCNKVREFGVRCNITPSGRLRVGGSESVDKFLNIIGPTDINCYNYKWDRERFYK